MRFSNSLYLTATYACSFLLPLVVSELKMTVVLNNGVLPTKEGYTCTPNDSVLIKKAIVVDDDRRLQTKTKAQCKDECAGVVPGSCHVTGCKGFRRQLESKNLRSNRLAGNRKLNDNDAICSYGLETLNKKIDALLPQLSASCQPVVKSMRNVTCFDDVRYAKVEGFNLWNADEDKIVAKNFKNLTSFCYTRNNLNIEAIANACVEEVEMTLVGPVNEKDDSKDTAPYTIFGFDDDNRKDLFGRRLPIGTYTVRTNLRDSYTPKSMVTFTVKQC